MFFFSKKTHLSKEKNSLGQKQGKINYPHYAQKKLNCSKTKRISLNDSMVNLLCVK